MERQSGSAPLRLAALLLTFTLAVLPLAARAETVLVMVEEAGCAWCARWNKEIGPIYGKTPEGQAAPLQRVDIGAPPGDIDFARGLHFTPTFVLVRDGAELARIEGYPGEDFFWGLLGQMLEQNGVALTASAGAEG
ncbi:hypothetical protein [Vannielia litorea]|uniref:hypothetical protein n=1 Tax=Vannielia litorea TaxID=1217970 RepID=UPI001C96E1AA|nr:hypothetical protein [Vannielia litorea]MBY6048549.1 hypothetical protein [Vannielia litorea]MBY6075963.1 hypothetical protein [Vannielia litorea]